LILPGKLFTAFLCALNGAACVKIFRKEDLKKTIEPAAIRLSYTLGAKNILSTGNQTLNEPFT
jgi:hypothetical protein